MARSLLVASLAVAPPATTAQPSASSACGKTELHDLPRLRDFDDALIARLRAGDPSAIDLVYRAHQRELRAFAQRVVGEHAAAEDLVHDVFVHLPAALRSFRGEGTLRGFLIGVAANRCARHIRSARRRRSALWRFLNSQPARAAEGAGCTPDPRAELLLRALDKLTVEQRTALVLCEVEGRTAKEAAQILGVAEATVRTRCFKGRKRLLELLERAT